EDLASSESKRAYAAIDKLLSSADATVQLLRQKVSPALATDLPRMRALLANLNSSKFTVRQQAQSELEALGELAWPVLEKALDGKPTLEYRRRVELLLQRLETPPSGRTCLRYLRALMILEMLGTPEARALLEDLVPAEPDAC